MPTPSRSTQARRRAAAESALAAVIVALVCALAVEALGGLESLRFARKVTWDWLTTRLDARAPDVVVVDISSITRPSNQAGRPVTDRVELLGVVKALRDAGARSIGIDIDFSLEEEGGSVSARDRDLLAWFSGLRDDEGTPIVVHVGVGRRLLARSGEWFGDPVLAQLGAAIAANASDNRLMPLAIATPAGEELPSLGVATARPCLPDGRLPECGCSSGLATPFHEIEDDGLRLTSFFVDFSTLPDLLDSRLPAASRVAELKEGELVPALQAELQANPLLVKGKAVFVGYADPARMQDNGFVMPGRFRALPGIYAHAAAAAALLGPGYLYKPSPLLEAGLDVGLAMALIAIVYWLRSRLWTRWSETDELALHPLLTAMVLLLLWTVLAPWLMVRWWRVIPDGLPIVTLALLAELLWSPVHVLLHPGSAEGKKE